MYMALYKWTAHLHYYNEKILAPEVKKQNASDIFISIFRVSYFVSEYVDICTQQ